MKECICEEQLIRFGEDLCQNCYVKVVEGWCNSLLGR